MTMHVDPDLLSYDDKGLVPVVVQDVVSGAVLMLAYANREAVEKTLATRQAHFWSRSRQSLWKKGETSGNVLEVVEVLADCDDDALLVRVRPAGPACHLGTRTCFEPNPARLEIGWLHAFLAERSLASPEESYTARLLSQGLPRVAQKVGEEGVEAALAGALLERRGYSLEQGQAKLAGEAADLIYHLTVLLLAAGVSPGEVAKVLALRHTPFSPAAALE